ncbi:MAG: HAD family hydrolase [Solirubrobacterales bacterium]
MITTIGFDGDDTLWHTESVFASTEQQYQRILAEFADRESLKERLFETEMRNLALFGYGVKSFMLSMLEAAIDVSGRRVSAMQMQEVLNIGKSMLERDVEPISGAEATLAALARRHRLLLITKGDLFDQESKLAQSGLSQFFSGVVIVSDKDAATYERVLSQHDTSVAGFVMVGNSLRSDVVPVVELGGRAIHVPYHVTWAHEEGDASELPLDRYRHVPAIVEVPAAITELDDEGRRASVTRD